MITGDQALSQPDEVQDPVTGNLGPTMPEEVLRREALLRSCRWLFAIMAAISIFSAGRTIYQVRGPAGPMGDVIEFFLPLLIVPSLAIGKSTAGFYALSQPRKTSRLILGILVWLCILGLGVRAPFHVYSLVMGAIGGYSHTPLMIVYVFLDIAPENIIIFAIAYLAWKGPGRVVYSPDGFAYFAQERTVKRAEIPWIAVGYAIFIGINWLVTSKMHNYLSNHP